MIDILAGMLELVGSYLIGNKNKFGFMLSICCTIWIYYAIDHKIYGLLIPTIPGLFISIRNFYKWKREEIKTQNNSEQ